MVAKVLIIEDDDVIAQGMARHLQAAGFDAVGVANGETGLARLRFERPDVCVLDLMLPGLDGWKVIEQARGEGIGTPIVVVSARGTEHDRVHALEIGADDYLVKPFSMKELAARVGAAARRGTRAQDPRRGDEIVIEELRLDPRNVQAYVDGTSADLTPTEFRLIYALALDEGRVLTRDELLQRVWGRRASHRDRTVDVFVRKLREKVDSRSSRHTFLQTRYGVGYKLEAEPEVAEPADGGLSLSAAPRHRRSHSHQRVAALAVTEPCAALRAAALAASSSCCAPIPWVLHAAGDGSRTGLAAVKQPRSQPARRRVALPAASAAAGAAGAPSRRRPIGRRVEPGPNVHLVYAIPLRRGRSLGDDRTASRGGGSLGRGMVAPRGSAASTALRSSRRVVRAPARRHDAPPRRLVPMVRAIRRHRPR